MAKYRALKGSAVKGLMKDAVVSLCFMLTSRCCVDTGVRFASIRNLVSGVCANTFDCGIRTAR